MVLLPAEIIKVISFKGEELRMRLTPSSTFRDIREHASEVWGYAFADTVLQDEVGCLWPDSGCLSAVSKTEDTVMLSLKPPALKSTNFSIGFA